jgi:hypothetical protein
MTSTTKWLLAGAALVFGLYGLDSTYRGWIEQPTIVAGKKIEKLQSEIEDAEFLQRKSRKAARSMEVLEGRSLPSDPDLARSKYREWLLSMIQQHDFQDASVDAGIPVAVEVKARVGKSKRKSIGYRIPFSLRSRATLAQWTAWMQQFEQAPHLHKIISLSITPLGNGSELNLQMELEAIALDSATQEEELSDWIPDPQVAPPPTASLAIVQRNLFATGFSKSLQALRLKAITTDRKGSLEAWFSGKEGASTTPYKAPSEVPVPLHQLQLTEIAADHVQIQIDGQSVRLNLGQSIADALSIRTAPTSKEPNP